VAPIAVPAEVEYPPAPVRHALYLPKIVHPQRRPPGTRPPRATCARTPRRTRSPAATRGLGGVTPGPSLCRRSPRSSASLRRPANYALRTACSNKCALRGLADRRISGPAHQPASLGWEARFWASVADCSNVGSERYEARQPEIARDQGAARRSGRRWDGSRTFRDRSASPQPDRPSESRPGRFREGVKCDAVHMRRTRAILSALAIVLIACGDVEHDPGDALDSADDFPHVRAAEHSRATPRRPVAVDDAGKATGLEAFIERRRRQTCCVTGCKSLSTDRANCGACGRICATGQSCVSGTCR
jgi:hypothetical protein